jgi:hypothetical protein
MSQLPRLKSGLPLLISLTLALQAVLLASPNAIRADDVFTIVVKKEEEKRKNRWSLSEWLETRDKMRVMDMWLALHSPSPYEFLFGTEYHFNSSTTKNENLSLRGGAYASIFGLELQRDFSPVGETHALFNARVFGYHAQGTNLTLQAGMRFRDEPAQHRNLFAGADLTLYLGRFIGVEGLYRRNFSSLPNSAGATANGVRLEAQGFIDFKMLRILAGWMSEQETGTLARNREAWTGGMRFFF